MPRTMHRDKTATLCAQLLATVTLIVFTAGVTDPVNVTKLFALGGFTLAVAFTITKEKIFYLRQNYMFYLIAVSVFVCLSILTLVKSPAPLVQSFYGVYGRNNGFLLYLLLCILFLMVLTIRSNNSFQKFEKAMWIAGITNLVYALWVLLFGDFVGWNNPYGSLLGTLGNPNFAGSFFGMFSGVVLVQLFRPKNRLLYRVCSCLLLILLVVGIEQTNAVQGRVLFVASALIVLLYYIRHLGRSWKPVILYLAVLFPLAIFAVAGTLQRGPFAEFLYKTSVSLRGEYWYSAFQTGMSNLWFGAGFDSFGDWYRRSRRQSSLVLPGPDTVTNAAHNVFLDIFAFGGILLFFCYLLLNLCVLKSIFAHFSNNKQFDSTFVALTSIWICYQLQSLISINQIGLSIWGWIIGAAIIAYVRNQQNSLEKRTNSVKRPESDAKKKLKITDSYLPSLIGAFIGLIICFPPLNSDMKWSHAQLTKSAADFEIALNSSWFNPQNSIKIDTSVALFESSQLFELSHKYALQAVEFNPNSFSAWENLYRITNSSTREKANALNQMSRLDPLNPKLKGMKAN